MGSRADRNPAATLVGRGRPVETSKGGIGAVYQFHADGTIDFSPGAITWPSNDVLRMSTQDQTEEYQHQGAAGPQDRLLGEWLTWREMNGQRMPEQMFFYPAGKSLLVIRFTTQLPGPLSVNLGSINSAQLYVFVPVSKLMDVPQPEHLVHEKAYLKADAWPSCFSDATSLQLYRRSVKR